MLIGLGKLSKKRKKQAEIHIKAFLQLKYHYIRSYIPNKRCLILIYQLGKCLIYKSDMREKISNNEWIYRKNVLKIV